MELTNEERVALNYKMDNPGKTVFCPRCGKEIKIIIYNKTGVDISCTTDNCIKKSLRGI